MFQVGNFKRVFLTHKSIKVGDYVANLHSNFQNHTRNKFVKISILNFLPHQLILDAPLQPRIRRYLLRIDHEGCPIDHLDGFYVTMFWVWDEMENP